MALIYVHKIMIGTAVGFCLLFAGRALWIGDLWLGAFFGVATAGLSIYFRWFLQSKSEQVLDARAPGDDGGAG